MAHSMQVSGQTMTQSRTWHDHQLLVAEKFSVNEMGQGEK
jgi:hypothetical protein